nr:integrase, catalytic region, zinc finger, CCHC-type, peptidase aspartic, catalytic [Tanacetum cinerariifolium]
MANVSKSFLIPNEDLSNDTKPSVARKFLNEVKRTLFTLQRVVKQRMTIETHNWASSAHQEFHKIEAAKFVGDFKSLAKEADDSLAKHKAMELDNECLLKAVISQDVMNIVQKESVIDTSDLQTELEHNTQNTSANTKFAKQPIGENFPKVGKTNALSKPVTSNSVSTPQASKGVNNAKVIAPGMFRISPDKISRKAKKVPNIVNASSRTKPTTVSQPNVITKKDVNSDLNGLSSTGLDNTKTRRPQPRSNTNNDRVPSASKSNRRKNKEAKVEEHHRNLLLSKNNKHISLACNNSKIDSQDVISKVVYASRGKKQKAKISVKEIQKNYQPKIAKPKKIGTRESFATPKPRKYRIILRWSPTGRLFDQDGKISDSSESKSQSDCSNGDNACCFKHMTGNVKLLINFVWKFLGTVRFGNEHIAIVLGFGDLQWGNILITRVYFVKGLGYNLFSVGQFCDSDLEVAFRKMLVSSEIWKELTCSKEIVQQTFIQSIFMKWPLHHQSSSWLELLLLS